MGKILCYETRVDTTAGAGCTLPDLTMTAKPCTTAPLKSYVSSLPKVTGIVLNVFPTRGYGFVSVFCEGSQLELYFRVSATVRGHAQLRSLAVVTMDVGPKGRPKVVQLQPCGLAPVSAI